MNRVVRDRYPVAKLPDDLRQGLDPQSEAIMTIDEIFAARLPPFRSAADIYREIRDQRDGWDG